MKNDQHTPSPELLMAARRVLAGLNARIDAAKAAGDPMPVFDGIADLHDAITLTEERVVNGEAAA